MKLRLAIVLVLLCYLTTFAHAVEVNFNILDQWDCGAGLKCAIAVDPQERVVIITTRGDTLVTIAHRGKIIYQEPKQKEKKS